MRFLLLSLLILAGSTALTQLLLRDPGYLMIVYGSWTLESTLAVAGVALLLIVAFLMLSLRLLLRIWQAPQRLRDWEEQRGRTRARRALIQGLLDLAEGDWRQAEGNLLRSVEQSETPLLNYLSAARAAHHLGEHERRDKYLELAHEKMPSADVAVSLTQAELQIAHDQSEQALDTLLHLRRVAPRHAHVLRLLKELLLRRQDWQGLHALLPELRRQRIGSLKELDALEIQANAGVLQAMSEDVDAIDRQWNALSRAMKAHPALIEVYSKRLMARGDVQTAEKLLRDSLNRSWSQALVERYGVLGCEDAAEQLSRAESWLGEHPQDSALLLTLGRLCLRNQLWGKARSYFEASIGAADGNGPRAYQELGALLEQMGDSDEALKCYRKGLLASQTGV
jgi:HemY protein